jgi:hypothetical protein
VATEEEYNRQTMKIKAATAGNVPIIKREAFNLALEQGRAVFTKEQCFFFTESTPVEDTEDEIMTDPATKVQKISLFF